MQGFFFGQDNFAYPCNRPKPLPVGSIAPVRSTKERTMIQRQPHQMVITTPKGRVLVARRLYERLQARMQPDDLGLLRDYDWWAQVSELVVGIQVTTPAPQKRAQR